MSELSFAPLETFADIAMGQSPDTETCNSDQRGMPFLQGCGEFGRRVPDTSIFCALPLRVGKTGSVLMSVRAPVGTMNYADQDYCIGRGLAAFKAKPGIANTTFLKHAVEQNSGFLHRRSQGSTFAAVSSGDVRTLPIPNFGFDKQNEIAAILTSIDTAIEKTEALIGKFQHIKAGLMHDLFTRGVLPNGTLRPPRTEAPELYQQTPIGWIPKEWALERCIDLCPRICVGIVIQPTQYYVVDGVPAFRSANVREDGIDATNFVYISPVANNLLVKSQLKTGDIVSVLTGYPGTSAVVPLEFHGANCIDILISSPGEKVSSEYLCDWINSSFGKEQVLRLQGGMAQQHFNVGEMRELLVALPSRAEQLLIRNRAKSVEKKLRLEKSLQEKFTKQKLGLMQDLLTVKVPVTTISNIQGAT
ncbi:MAG: restriction endonuclease subunit S [Rhodoferax sp.]|nr:restriction endonuclease subunit S [Rhodoferax sp.]